MQNHLFNTKEQRMKWTSETLTKRQKGILDKAVAEGHTAKGAVWLSKFNESLREAKKVKPLEGIFTS